MKTPGRTLSLGFATALLALLFFAWLAGDVIRGQTIAFDAPVREGIHAWASPPLTLVMKWLTVIGSAWVLPWTCVAAIWLLDRAGRRRAAILLAVAVIGGEALDQILKLFFHRPRPEPFFGFPAPFTYSFPSGHALTAICFYGALAAILSVRRRSLAVKAGLWVAAVVMAAAIGLSRVYLGVHYPSDVLAGYAAAVVWVGAVRAGYALWLRRLGTRSARAERIQSEP